MGHYPCPEIETIHLKFCKFALGVPTSACNLACYGELGHSLENLDGEILAQPTQLGRPCFCIATCIMANVIELD